MEDEKLFSILSYVPFLCIIVYITKDGNENIRFHAKQGVVIFAFYIAGVLPLIGSLLSMVGLVLSVLGAAKAYKGIKYKIPYIYELSNKINF